MNILQSISTITLLVLLIIIIILTVIYAFSSFEKGNLKSYQEKSDYNFVNLSKGKTAYKDYGNKNDPAIIIIHGATLPSEGYVGFCEGLSLKGYRVICYDQYGRGYSDRPVSDYNMEFYLDQLNELLDYLEIKKSILHGSSMGAPIAINYANKYPNQVSAIGLQVPLVNSNSKILSILKTPILGNFVLRTFGIPFSKNRAEQWVTNNPEQRDLVDRYIAQLTLPGTEQSLLSSIRNIANTNFIPDYKKFSQSDIPIHIAYASDDDEIDPKTVQRVLDLIPRAESFVFTGGHGGGGFIVDELNNIFTDFLNKNLN